MYIYTITFKAKLNPVDSFTNRPHEQSWTLALARSPMRVSKVLGEHKSQFTRQFGKWKQDHPGKLAYMYMIYMIVYKYRYTCIDHNNFN